MNEADGKTAGRGSEPDGDDQDLAALFDAGNTGDNSPPELLSARILAAAHEAVAHEPQVPEPESMPPGLHSQRWQNSGRWMAMAASVLLAVLVTPLLLRAPESVMESDAVEASRLKAVQQSLGADTATTVAPADTRENSSGIQLQQQAAPMVLSPTPEASPPAPMVQGIQVRKRSALADRAEANDDVQEMAEEEEVLSEGKPVLEEEPVSGGGEGLTQEAFRNTAESWVAHIRQLEEDEQYDEAVEEYGLFREQYPNHEPGFSEPRRP